MKPITEIIEELTEQLASIEHERWAKWQKYMHSKCFEHTINSLNATTKQFEDIPTGNLVIPRDLRNRWERQINLIYEELSEQEKESDREQVRMYLPLITNTLKERDEEFKKMVEGMKRVNEEFGFCKFEKHHMGDMIHDDICGSYNKAIEDILSKLNQE